MLCKNGLHEIDPDNPWRSSDGRRCRECFLANHRRKNASYRSREIGRAARKRGRVTQEDSHWNLINAAKRNGCVDCGFRPADPSELHFHHRDPASKSFQPSQGSWRSRRLVLAEITKCDVLCGPCHRTRHRTGQLVAA